MSYRSVQTFPRMTGADTQIIISSRLSYQLHSVQLRQCSNLFSQLLSRPGPQLTQNGRRTGVRYLLVLQNYDEFSGDEIVPVIRRVELSSEGRPARAVTTMHEEEQDNNVRPGLFDDYDRVLGSFFNVDLQLDTSDVTKALWDCFGLLEVAEYLGSVHMIANSIDNALLSKGQTLYQAIAKDPILWINLAYRISSKPLFKESLVHLTGKYNALSLQAPDPEFKQDNPFSRTVLDQLPSELRDLLEEKNKKMKAKCLRVEMLMATTYPADLQKDSVTGRADRDDIGRQSYSRDVFRWIAVGLHRHWFAARCVQNENRDSPTGGYALYKKLHMAGQTYLDRESVSSFHTRFPMSSKGKSVVQAHLDDVKTSIAQIVSPLMVEKCALDTKAMEVSWLTCLEVGEDDYLWEREARVREKTRDKEGREKGKEKEVRERGNEGESKVRERKVRKRDAEMAFVEESQSEGEDI